MVDDEEEMNKRDEEEELMLLKRALEGEPEPQKPMEKPPEPEIRKPEEPEEKNEERELEDEYEGQEEKDAYTYDADGIPVSITIVVRRQAYVPEYQIQIPLLAEGTKIILNALKGDLITQVKLDVSELIDRKQATKVKKKFEEKASELLDKQFTGLTPEKKECTHCIPYPTHIGIGRTRNPYA